MYLCKVMYIYLHVCAPVSVCVCLCGLSFSLPSVCVLCSMGGAIATRAAASGNVNSLVGLVVIDVVEGIIYQTNYIYSLH